MGARLCKVKRMHSVGQCIKVTPCTRFTWVRLVLGVGMAIRGARGSIQRVPDKYITKNVQ